MKSHPFALVHSVLFQFTGPALLLILSGCFDPDPRWMKIIEQHQQRYPRMEIADVYKLILQSTQGVEHLLHDTVAAKKYLFDEFRHIDTTEFMSEALVDPLDSDSMFVRINLRPYRRQGGDVQQLWQAMWTTASASSTDKATFIETWSAVRKKLSKPPFSWSEADVRQFDERMTKLQYPVIHHSEAYARTYKPAYRVVLKSEFDKLGHRISKP